MSRSSSPLRSLLLCRYGHRYHVTLGIQTRLISENHTRRQGSQLLKRFNPPIFSGLLIFGLGLTAYGIYHRLHDAMTMWPPHLRQNLRQGLYAKRKGDLGTALSFLSKAWEDTKSTPLDALGADPILKLTGVAITLAGVFEDAGLKEQAYRTYEEGLFYMINKPSEPVLDLTTDSLRIRLTTPEDKIRALSIAYKLGELAKSLQKPLAEEEKWLTLSVEALLAIMPHAPNLEIRKPLEELELPSWAMANDFAAPLEALGNFYSRVGRHDYASILYMQAINFLLPPNSRRSPTVEEKCRAAQIMGNLAELSLRRHPSDNIPPEVLSDAQDRVKEALELTRTARRRFLFTHHEFCEEVYVVLLYNFAMLRQFAGDVDTAREHFRQSLQQAKAIDMQNGISEAEAALSKLESSRRV